MSTNPHLPFTRYDAARIALESGATNAETVAALLGWPIRSAWDALQEIVARGLAAKVGHAHFRPTWEGR